MAKKPDYANLTLDEPAAEADIAPAPATKRQPRAEQPTKKGRTLKEAAVQTVIYLHPAASKTLKRYALEQDKKPHDLLIEALETWFKSHGLQGPVRAETARSK
jgi:hypothetical protein